MEDDLEDAVVPPTSLMNWMWPLLLLFSGWVDHTRQQEDEDSEEDAFTC